MFTQHIRFLGSILIIILAFHAVVTLAASFNVHRLIQYSSGNTIYGSQKASVNMPSATLDTTGSLSGLLVTIPIQRATLENVKEIIETRKPGGLLFLIPDDGEMQIQADFIERWKAIETYMISTPDIKIPIWFSMATEGVKQLYEQIVSESSLATSTDSTTLVIDSREPSLIKKQEIINIQGLLTGMAKSPDQEELPMQSTDKESSKSSSDEGNDQDDIDEFSSTQNLDSSSSNIDVTKIPTIAITAYWDSFSNVPALSVSANQGASGIVALLQTARTVSKLYSNSKTQARYNIVFLMSSGSRLHNFAGTRHWLDSSVTGLAIRDSLEYVICLDSLGTTSDLFLHVSRPSKDPKAANLYEIFTEVAEKRGINLSVSQRKINIADATVAWEHEVFARRKILAVTLSQVAAPQYDFQRSNIFDRLSSINADCLQRNIHFLIEVVTRIIYHQESTAPSIVEGSLAPNATLNEGWLSVLTSTPRMIPYMESKSPSLVDYLESTLKQYASDVSRQTVKSDFDIQFYDVLSGHLASYRVKSASFDLILLLIILAFNAVIYSCLKGVKAALADFGEIGGWVKGIFIPRTASSKSKKN